jgi:hypothetical protein
LKPPPFERTLYELAAALAEKIIDMADVPLRPRHRIEKPWLWNRGFAIKSME